METFKVFLLLLVLSSIVFCAEEKGRRRKVRRKVLRRPQQEVVNVYEPEDNQEEGRGFVHKTVDSNVLDLSENTDNDEDEELQQDMSVVEEDRAGRG
jgi:hypothetical protein